MARATMSRCAMPPERAKTDALAYWDSWNREQLVGGLPRCLRSHAEQPTVEVEVLPDGELPVERVLLRDHPAQLLRQGRVRGDIYAGEKHPSRRRNDARRQHPDGRRLPRAVRPEQAEDLPGPGHRG